MELGEARLAQLNEALLRFIETYQGIDHPETVWVDQWNAIQILGHITFWHESFARNVDDLVNGRTPRPLRGRFRDLNPAGVAALGQYPPEVVLQRLTEAHRVILANIQNPELTVIPYKVGSRAYTPGEHLDVVSGHITAHRKDLEKALQRMR